jgi:hypothetical protein
MYLEKRPTSVTVIGWAWVVISALMIFSSVMGLLASMMAGEMMHSQGDAGFEAPLMFRIFPLLAAVQMLFAGLGLVAGLSFLKLKAWSRPVLEVQTWILLAFVVGFMIYWMHSWVSMTSGMEVATDRFALMGLVMAVVMTAVYAVPIGFMLRSLRGAVVKAAMN